MRLSTPAEVEHETVVNRVKVVFLPDAPTPLLNIADIVRADYLDGYRLRVVFSDGHETNVDFGPFLSASRHPDIRKYLNPEQFAHYALADGDLMWGDYNMILPVHDLYKGKI